MTGAAELLAELAAQGIHLEVEGENLRPSSRLPPALRAKLTGCKPELLAHLNRQTAATPRFAHPGPGPQAPTAEHARYLAENGVALVHVPRGTKGPTYRDWQKNPITDPQAAARYYSQHPSDGIGAVLGPSGLCSLDVDDPARARQALAAVGIDLDGLLDDSSIPRVEGNPEKARLLLRAPAGEMLPTRKLTLPGQKDGQHAVILELRAGPVQDLLPPSWHPSGKPYRWLRAPWEGEEIPEPAPALLYLWRRWDELLPRMLAAVAPEAGQEQAVREYRVQRAQGNGDSRWDVVRRQIGERLALADLLAQMGRQEQGRGRYCCPFHEELNPSFWLHGDLWICAHGGAPVGFTSSKTGYSVGDVVDLYQHWKGLERPGKATAELARELGIALPDSSLLTARKLPLENSKPDLQPTMGASRRDVEQLSAPMGARGPTTTRYTRQTPASLRESYRPTEWTVDSLLPFPGVGLIAGIPGIGKTWLSLLFALAVATGKPLWGHFRVRQGPVLLVLEEEDENSIVERLSLLYGPLGLSQAEGDALPIHFLVQQGVQLVTPDGQLDPELVRHIEEVQPALIPMDPLRRAHGLDENDSGQMSVLFNLMRQLTRQPERPCSLLLVHHLRKRSPHAEDALDRLRGSSDIAASVDSVLEIGGTFPNLVARHSKSKRGPALGGFMIQGPVTPLGVDLRYVNQDQKVSADRERLRAWLVDFLQKAGKPVSQTELVKAGKPLRFGRDRIRQMCETLEGEILSAFTGPRNSRLYGLRDQFTEGGAGAENNNSELVEVEV